MSIGKVFLGTLAGLAVGAISGILLAPEKGSETRRQILDEGEDYVDNLKSKFDGFRDSVASKVESTHNVAENIADKGKAKFDDVKKDVKKVATNLKEDGAAGKFSYNNG